MKAIGKLLFEGTNCVEEDYEWDDYNYAVNNSKFKTGHFYVEVKNFGWRKLNGYSYCRADKMTALLTSILPNTECDFKVHNWGNGFAIQNFHHDNTCGDEWYYCKPISETTYRRNKQ